MYFHNNYSYPILVRIVQNKNCKNDTLRRIEIHERFVFSIYLGAKMLRETTVHRELRAIRRHIYIYEYTKLKQSTYDVTYQKYDETRWILIYNDKD